MKSLSDMKWKEVKLGDLLNFRRGHDLPKTSMLDGTIPVVGSNGVIGFHNIFTTKAPCLTIGRSGNIGNPCFINEDCWAHNTTLYVVNFKGNDPKYLYYLLKTLDLGYYGGGSAVPTLNRNHIHPLMVRATDDLLEQKAIADTLSCIDDKIELNNRINKTLEEMAQAIFKSWFVDFGPFQDGEFEESELGRIPKGWRVVSISEVKRVSNTGGDAIKKTPMVDFNTGIKCVRVGDLSNGRGFDGWGYSNVSKENFKKYQLKKNDIIVTRTATLGLNQIVDEDLLGVYNNGLIVIKLNEEIIPLFFYHSINTDDYKEYIGRIESESSTRPNMKMNYLLKYKFIYPPIKIQKLFADTAIALREQRLNFHKQNKCLITIRDSLLPKLMSGEIRIPLEEVQ